MTMHAKRQMCLGSACEVQPFQATHVTVKGGQETSTWTCVKAALQAGQTDNCISAIVLHGTTVLAAVHAVMLTC